MKAAAPNSDYVLLRHWCREQNLPHQTIRDAAAREEFDVLELGREHSRRLHLYARRADLAAWLDRHTRKKRPAGEPGLYAVKRA